MTSDTSVSKDLSDQDVSELLASLAAMKAKLPFLVSLTPQERKELPKMGDKSIGFDDKCCAYMQSSPQFLPGFVDAGVVQKQRELRRVMLRIHADVAALNQTIDDTLLTVNSEIWRADLAYYQSAHEAARRGLPAAQIVYNDLRHRFPGSSGGGSSGAGTGVDTPAAAVGTSSVNGVLQKPSTGSSAS